MLVCTLQGLRELRTILRPSNRTYLHISAVEQEATEVQRLHPFLICVMMVGYEEVVNHKL